MAEACCYCPEDRRDIDETPELIGEGDRAISRGGAGKREGGNCEISIVFGNIMLVQM